MKSINKNLTDFSLKKRSKKYGTKGRGKDEDDMKIVEASVIEKADTTSAESGTTFKACIFNVDDCPQTDLFVRIKKIEKPNIPLRHASLSQVTFLHSSIRMYGFDYSRGVLSVTCSLGASKKYVTTRLTSFITVDCPVLINGAKVLMLSGWYFLE